MHAYICLHIPICNIFGEKEDSPGRYICIYIYICFSAYWVLFKICFSFLFMSLYRNCHPFGLLICFFSSCLACCWMYVPRFMLTVLYWRTFVWIHLMLLQAMLQWYLSVLPILFMWKGIWVSSISGLKSKALVSLMGVVKLPSRGMYHFIFLSAVYENYACFPVALTTEYIIILQHFC